MTLPLCSPIITLPLPTLWLLSACSLFQCLWFYFACLFVLLIRFHLYVRSYGVCLSPPGLFHLAQCSPDPPMLSWRVGAPSFFLLCSIPLCKCTTMFFCFFNIFIDYAITVVPFPPLTPLHPAHPLPPTFPPNSSCPWVILISSLASTFPTLFLPSPCLFSTYHLCYLFSVPSPPLPLPHPCW